MFTCHEDLIYLFNEVLQIHDCSIVCGHRNEEDQHTAFTSHPQRSKLDWPNGKHNKDPSIAVDVSPYIAEVGIDANNPDHLKYFYHFSGGVLFLAAELCKQGAMAHRIRWGGDWDSDKNMDDQTFNDLYHFELVGVRDV